MNSDQVLNVYQIKGIRRQKDKKIILQEFRFGASSTLRIKFWNVWFVDSPFKDSFPSLLLHVVRGLR